MTQLNSEAQRRRWADPVYRATHIGVIIDQPISWTSDMDAMIVNKPSSVKWINLADKIGVSLSSLRRRRQEIGAPFREVTRGYN